MRKKILRHFYCLSICLLFTNNTTLAETPSNFENSNKLTEKYKRASKIQSFSTNKSLLNQYVLPHWDDERDVFWYKKETKDGHKFMIVDALKQSNKTLLNHKKLAQKLAKASKKTVISNNLPINILNINPTKNIVEFSAYGKKWSYQTSKNKLKKIGNYIARTNQVLSPDGTKSIFSKDFNLWIKDIKNNKDTQLTTDGQKYFSYGSNPDAIGRPAIKPEVIWSPDSKKILTVQTDDRMVKDLPMIDFAPKGGGLRPRAFSYRTSLPGDKNITKFRMVAIDVEQKTLVEANYPWVIASRMNDTPIGGNRAWLSKDGSLAYFVDIQRGEKLARVIEFNTQNGQSRILFEEKSDTYLELGSGVYTPTFIIHLPDTEELIWYSERSGWAHLYLYDLKTGKLKRQLTNGDWLVRGILGFNKESREVFITQGNVKKGRNPYYRQIARVNIDTAILTVLSESDADHKAFTKSSFEALILGAQGKKIDSISSISPSGNFFVETVTRADRRAISILRSHSGKKILTIEKADISNLPPHWQHAEPIKLLAADNKTEIRGLLFRPSDFSPEKKYPIVDYIYGGPQTTLVPESIGGNAYLDAASVAELGFITVIIDGRGTTERSREFHEASYGNIHNASNLEDHIAGIKQLAQKYSYIDINRVGIFGFSGGGYMTANALLRFPDFFKVGIAGAGNHDQRLFWHSWGERYHGLMDGDNYLKQANLTYAKNLKGKLMFIHGLLDSGVHPAHLFQLTQALINENKDFDLVILPQEGHSLNGYAQKKMWNYLLKHLKNEELDQKLSHKSQSQFLIEKIMAAAKAQQETIE